MKRGIGGVSEKNIPPPISRRSLKFLQRDFLENVFIPVPKQTYRLRIVY
nr:MAG TPA: hypothetical protein [Caudoviricetes sp.]